MAFQLAGKKVLITGGAMGIGFATCKRLVKEGCDLTIWDLNESALNQAISELSSSGTLVKGHVCDVSDKSRVQELAETAKKEMGKVDILINNAGLVKPGMFWEVPLEDSIKQFEVNLNALLYGIHSFLPDMLERNSGHIVNVSSGVAITSVPGLPAYSASKWAAWGLTDVLRLEVATAGKNGVHFTSVHPGNILHGMFEGFELNWLGKLLFPPVKHHDQIAKGVVESGLKKKKHLVVIPKQLYLGMMIRGWIPNSLLVRASLMAGGGSAIKNYVGREENKV